LKGGQFSKHVTQMDAAFALSVMRDFDKIPIKEERKKDKLVGERLEKW